MRKETCFTDLNLFKLLNVYSNPGQRYISGNRAPNLQNRQSVHEEQTELSEAKLIPRKTVQILETKKQTREIQTTWQK